MKTTILSAAIALLALPAFAQDPSPDFSGAYVSLNFSRSNSSSSNAVNAATSKSSDPSLTLGYGFDLGGLVVGGELVHRRSNYSGTIVATGAAFDGTITGNSLGVKLGYPVGRAMPFISARVGQGTDKFATGSMDLRSSELTLGAEYALTDRISTIVSYEHITLNYDNSPLTVTSNHIGLGLAYRF